MLQGTSELYFMIPVAVLGVVSLIQRGQNAGHAFCCGPPTVIQKSFMFESHCRDYDVHDMPAVLGSCINT
jgi:hypothetical protein